MTIEILQFGNNPDLDPDLVIDPDQIVDQRIPGIGRVFSIKVPI